MVADDVEPVLGTYWGGIVTLLTGDSRLATFPLPATRKGEAASMATSTTV